MKTIRFDHIAILSAIVLIAAAVVFGFIGDPRSLVFAALFIGIAIVALIVEQARS